MFLTIPTLKAHKKRTDLKNLCAFSLGGACNFGGGVV